MTIVSVAVDDPVQASTMNHLIDKANASPGRAIFTANGTFNVPNGVHKFRVYLAAGGQGGNNFSIGGGGLESYIIPGPPGANAHMSSAEFVGVDIGTSFAVTVGAGGSANGGAGGTTSFGSTYSATGASGGKGTVTFPGGSNPMYHGNDLYMNSAGQGYGQGGTGATDTVLATAGVQGIVVVEW